jgi:DNA-binding response OmpR family regulator
VKILAIDDNLDNLKYISEILKVDFPNYQVFLSQSGIEGIQIAKRELPDTILLDILMPIMDGFEVCNILKRNKSTQHIPVVFLSALNEMSSRIKGLNTGADAYISKPFNRAEFKAQVNVMLRIKFAEDLLSELGGKSSNTFKEKINSMMGTLPRIRDGYIARELESQKARRPEEIARKECQRSFSFSQQSAILDTQHMSEIAPAVNAAYRAQGKEQLQFENIDKVKIDLAYLEELLNTTQDITEMENARGQVLLYTRSIAKMSEKMDIAFKDIQAQYRIISEKLFGDPVYLPKANDIVTNFENYYKKAIDDGAAERQDYITQTIIDQGSVELSLAGQAGLDREQKYHLQQLFDSAYSTPTKLDRDRKNLERLYRKPYTYVKQMEIIKPSDFSSSNVDNGDQKQQKSVFQNLKSGFSKYLNGTKETLSSGIKYVSDKVKGAVKSVRENTSSQLNKLFGRSTKNK